jgi:hypothetical protein
MQEQKNKSEAKKGDDETLLVGRGSFKEYSNPY